MSFTGRQLRRRIQEQIQPFSSTSVHHQLHQSQVGPLAIKYVDSRWAEVHARPSPLKVSSSLLQTWGTATYVSPITHPLSSALYGRIGVVSDFDPTGWNVFDATSPQAQSLYLQWARSQPEFEELLLTVHSTRANHEMRNRFRQHFHIDCVLFRPDQEAELHTDPSAHVWMAVSDWSVDGRTLTNDMSRRLANGRFTVLIDEDFRLPDDGLPASAAARLIEPWTSRFGLGGAANSCLGIRTARRDPQLPARIADAYQHHSYVHLYIEP